MKAQTHDPIPSIHLILLTPLRQDSSLLERNAADKLSTTRQVKVMKKVNILSSEMLASERPAQELWYPASFITKRPGYCSNLL